jgi:uncharacterized repeat protein (TIGR01451 family)
MTLKERIRAGGIIAITFVAIGFVFLGNQRPVHAQVDPVPAGLGQQIVCFVFSTLDDIGNPIPNLDASGCPAAITSVGALKVAKIVNGGTAAPSDFKIHVKSGSIEVGDSPRPGSLSGTTYVGLVPGSYSVSESGGPSGYSASFAGGCNADGVVSVASSTIASSCTITNTFNGGEGGVSNSDLSITKSANVLYPHPGDTVIYTVTVSNTGPDADTGVLVNDALPQGLTYISDDSTSSATTYNHTAGLWTVGSIVNGAHKVLHITTTVNSGTEGDSIVNTAVATGGSTDSNSENNNGSATIMVNGGGNTQSDLTLTKTVSNLTPHVGDQVTYTLVVKNNGPATATGVSVTDILPTGLTYVTDDATTTGMFYAATTTKMWTIGTLANGATATLHLVASVNTGTEGNSITNSAMVADNNGDPNNNNNNGTSTITVSDGGGSGGNATTSDITVSKTVDNAAPNLGGAVNYTVTVSDTGIDATGVVVQDLLPSGITFVSTSTADTVGTYASSTGLWTIGSISSTTPALLHITATVNAGQSNGTVITNVANVTAGDTSTNSGNNIASSSITVTIPTSGGGGCVSGCGGGGGPSNGGGGNGPIAGSYGGGGNGPIVPNGQVLGASTSTLPTACSQYLTAFIGVGRNNDSSQVIRLQTFLNSYEGDHLMVNGVYDAATLAATNAFQKAYASDILTPWGITNPTGFVYLTTRKEVNTIYCHFTQNFPLTPAQQAIIDASRTAIQDGTSSMQTGSSATPRVTSQAVSTPGTNAPTDGTNMNLDASSTSNGSSASVTNNPFSGIGNFFKRLFGGQ